MPDLPRWVYEYYEFAAALFGTLLVVSGVIIAIMMTAR